MLGAEWVEGPRDIQKGKIMADTPHCRPPTRCMAESKLIS